MNKLRRIFSRLAVFGFLIVLAGCDAIMLNPKGLVAADEKQLLIDSVLLMLIIVVPVLILTIAFAVRYRASNTKAKYQPQWGHSTLLEVICWTVPCIIIVILAALTWVTTHKLDPYKPLDDVKGKPLTVQVIALNWRWLFIYPEQNVATINYLQFPVNRQVKFFITADAPMNSFQIPQLGGQIYAMPGMQTKLHLIANHMGDYAGFSASFSGTGFSDMKFTAKVTSAEDFDKWVKSVKQTSTHHLTKVLYNKELAPDSENSKVQYFSSVDKAIYDNVMMKYMMPMPENTTDKKSNGQMHKMEHINSASMDMSSKTDSK